jgi:hypothetical protein
MCQPFHAMDNSELKMWLSPQILSSYDRRAKIWCLGSFLEMECEKMLLEGTYPVSGGDTPRSCVRRGHTSILVRRGRLDPVSRGHTSILARRGRTSILYQHGREYLGPYVTVWLRCFWGRWEKRRKSMGSQQEAYTSCTSMGLGIRIYGCIYQHRQKACAVNAVKNPWRDWARWKSEVGRGGRARVAGRM